MKPSRVAVLLFLLCLGLAAVELFRWGLFLHLPGYTDFGDYYLYARMGLHDGWSTLYDVTVEQREWQALGGVTVLPMFPMIYTPPLAWLVAPFALLPLRLAFPIWATLILALFLWIWTVTAPGSRLTRWTYLAAAIGVFPVAFGLMLAQVMIVVLAAVVGAWWLLGRKHELAAGLLLIVMVVKPQLAFLVPVALLATGYWRAVGVWAVGTVLVVGVALVSLGPDGARFYESRLHAASLGAPEFLVNASMTVPGLLGRGVAGWLGQAVMAGLALVAAYRQRHQGPAAPVVAGLIGSLLVTPYLHIEDLTVLFVAAWLYLQMVPPRLGRLLLVLGYAAMLPSVLFRALEGMEPAVVVLEAVWLLLIAWPLELRPAGKTSRSAELAA